MVAAVSLELIKPCSVIPTHELDRIKKKLVEILTCYGFKPIKLVCLFRITFPGPNRVDPDGSLKPGQ